MNLIKVKNSEYYTKYKRMLFLYHLGVQIPEPFQIIISIMEDYFNENNTFKAITCHHADRINECYNKKNQFIYTIIEYDYRNNKRTGIRLEMEREGGYKKAILSPLSTMLRTEDYPHDLCYSDINALTIAIINKKGWKIESGV